MRVAGSTSGFRTDAVRSSAVPSCRSRLSASACKSSIAARAFMSTACDACREGRVSCLLWEGSLSYLWERQGELSDLGGEPFLPRQ